MKSTLGKVEKLFLKGIDNIKESDFNFEIKRTFSKHEDKAHHVWINGFEFEDRKKISDIMDKCKKGTEYTLLLWVALVKVYKDMGNNVSYIDEPKEGEEDKPDDRVMSNSSKSNEKVLNNNIDDGTEISRFLSCNIEDIEKEIDSDAFMSEINSIEVDDKEYTSIWDRMKKKDKMDIINRSKKLFRIGSYNFSESLKSLTIYKYENDLLHFSK